MPEGEFKASPVGKLSGVLLMVRANCLRPAEQIRWATTFGLLSERSACDQRINLGRRLFLVFLGVFLLKILEGV